MMGIFEIQSRRDYTFIEFMFRENSSTPSIFLPHVFAPSCPSPRGRHKRLLPVGEKKRGANLNQYVHPPRRFASPLNEGIFEILDLPHKNASS